MPKPEPTPMPARDRWVSSATAALMSAVCVLAAWGAAGAQAAEPSRAETRPAARWVNATAGGPLRAGVYGRIEVARGSTAPPLIHAKPVVARAMASEPGAEPVYLYVPPGHVRKWSRHCQRYDACARPVFFVRVDDNPGKLGKWKPVTRAAPPGLAELFAFSD